MGKFYINLNGSIENEETAKISVLDRGFLYGDSVYEATRTFNKIPLRIDQHINRLFESALKIYFKPVISKNEVLKEVLKTIEICPFPNANIRIVLSRGTNSDLGLNPELSTNENLVIYLKELKENPSWWYTEGVSLTFFQKETSSKGSLPKTGNYIENMLANRFAIQNGFYDSIMVNNDGSVTECTTSNIWIVKNGSIYTPPLSVGVLPGLTRHGIIQMSDHFQHKILEKELSKAELLDADECFLTSTTRDIVPVTKINETKIGLGTPGVLTLKLLSDYRSQLVSNLRLITSI